MESSTLFFSFQVLGRPAMVLPVVNIYLISLCKERAQSMNLERLSKLKRKSLMLAVSLLSALLALTISLSFASSYEYYTLVQTNFVFDNAATIYYEYGTSDSNTVVVNQALNGSLNAIANYSSSADTWHNIAQQFRDELNFSGVTRLRGYTLPNNSNYPGVDSLRKIKVSNNFDLNYYFSQFRDLIGDSTVSAITLSFRFACFYSGENDPSSSYEDFGKLNMFGYNLVPDSFDIFQFYPNAHNPNLPSPNGYALDAYFNVNVLVDSLSDLFNVVIPFYYELSGLSPGYPAQASIATGFVFSDMQLGIGFDRSVSELIDVNENLIDLRGDIQELQGAIDRMNDPDDPSYTSPPEFSEGQQVLDNLHRAGRAYDEVLRPVESFPAEIPFANNALIAAKYPYEKLSTTPIFALVMFSCCFGLALFVIGSLKGKY